MQYEHSAINDRVEQNLDAATNAFVKEFQSELDFAGCPRLREPQRFFAGDETADMIHDIVQVLARGNLNETSSGAPHRPGGLLDSFAPAPSPDEYWHESNSVTDMSRFIEQNRIAYEENPEGVLAALSLLRGNLEHRMLDFEPGNTMERDRLRQLAENAALIAIAVAQSDGSYMHAFQAGGLTMLAQELGANPLNLEQIYNAAMAMNKRLLLRP